MLDPRLRAVSDRAVLLRVVLVCQQELWTHAKTTAMDLMFIADRADQEASKEEGRLRDMQRAPSHSEEALFDNRASQRRLWMTKNEAALQVEYATVVLYYINAPRHVKIPVTLVFKT